MEYIKQKESLDITFQHVTYQIEQSANQKRRCILNNVSGIFKGGQVNIIMGPSGCGKSTLLNLISSKIQNQSGNIYINNLPLTYENFGSYANYIMQYDYLMSTLTVQQTFRFAVDLKSHTKQQDKDKIIDNMIRKLKLQSCKDVLIGGHLIKGISGGQKRRTSIGFQLISDPQIVVLDQPTSGLDSLTSYIVMKYLKQLASDKNKTIIATIHQPNSQIFELFDNLILMVEGSIVYQDKANKAISYLDQHFGLKCPQFYNPADYIMHILHQEGYQNRQRYPLYIQQYQKQYQEYIKDRVQNRKKNDPTNKVQRKSFCNELKVLVQRDFLKVIRNPLMVRTRSIQVIILFLFIGGLYYQMDDDYTTRSSWQSLLGISNFIALNGLFMPLLPMLSIFSYQRQVFIKEQNSKLYSTISYFISKNIIELPYAFVFPLLQTLILYWLVGFSNTLQQFLIFFVTIFLLNFNGMSLGLLYGCIAYDYPTSIALSLSTLFPLYMYSGLFKNIDNLPSWIGWLQYISPIKYGFIALIQNQLKYNDTSFRMQQLNFDIGMQMCILILIVLSIVYRFIGFICLKRIKHRIYR